MPQASKPKRKTPAKQETTDKNEPDSFLKSVEHLIANKPDDECGNEHISKFLERAWGLFFRGTHQSFLIAYNVGGILAAIRACLQRHRTLRCRP